ncbi:unnamed protein product [Withania somnifera]
MGRKEDDGVERSEGGVVIVKPKPGKGLTTKALDLLERGIVKLMHDSSKPLHYLQGNFAPTDETPPLNKLVVQGHLPECLNGEFVRVGPNPKFTPIGDLKGLFGLFTVYMQMVRTKLKVLDISYGNGTANMALVYHHGMLLALSEADKPYALTVLEDGDLRTLGMLDYDKRLAHSFTAHPKVDPVTGEMFTFGYSHSPPYITYRVISKDEIMQDPVPITIPEPIMMHDFAITENYAIMMHLPLCFRPKEIVKNNKLSFTFDATKKALIKWFELPNCFIFHNDKQLCANAWEEGDEVVLITCRVMKPDLDMVNGAVKEKLENFSNELYKMRFNMKSGVASHKNLSESAVDFPRINENYTGRKSAVNVIDAKKMSAEPVAVVELLKRVPYGFHAFFVTEEQIREEAKL